MVPLTTVSTPTHSDNDSGPLPTLTQLFIIFHFAVTFLGKFAFKLEQEMMLMIPMTPYREFSVKLTWNTHNLMGYGLIIQKKPQHPYYSEEIQEHTVKSTSKSSQ